MCCQKRGEVISMMCSTKHCTFVISNNHYIHTVAMSSTEQPQPQPLSRYESQKRRDWNTFGQYLKNQSPPVSLSHCNYNHVLDFLRYLDQFGKTKVHLHACIFFGHPSPPAPCACPLRQAWGSLDALIGRLRAAYEEHGGSPDTNPFGGGAIRLYLREVKDCQSKARGIPYNKKKKKKQHHQLRLKATAPTIAKLPFKDFTS
ncbi:hypothetical protein S83_045510 [Arachis hypogaea]